MSDLMLWALHVYLMYIVIIKKNGNKTIKLKFAKF